MENIRTIESSHLIEIKDELFVVYSHYYWTPDDEGYYTECEAKEGFISQGDTLKEALEHIRERIEEYLEVEASQKLKEILDNI